MLPTTQFYKSIKSLVTAVTDLQSTLKGIQEDTFMRPFLLWENWQNQPSDTYVF